MKQTDKFGSTAYYEGWRDDASIKRIVNATFPDYRKKKIGVQAVESVTLQDLNWSGGTRSEYRSASLDGQRGVSTIGYSQAAPWNNKAEGASTPIPQGFCLVRGGYFCGKPSTLTIYVNPADMPRLLPAPQ